MMVSMEKYLSEHPFLSNLPEEHISLIVGCASNVRFDPGEFIFQEGQEAKKFYIIRHGKISLELNVPQRGPVCVETISEGDVLGWSWMFPPYHWHFDARARELTRAIALDGHCLRKKCEEDHDLGYELLKKFGKIVSERLQATRLQLLDVYGMEK